MKTPLHLGIIMDGNGRWARKRGLPTIMGHRAGGETAEKIITYCAKKGIKALTLYSFSTENWSRPKKEVDALMNLFKENLIKKTDKLIQNKVRFRVIGRRVGLSRDLLAEIRRVEEATKGNKGLALSLAVNYGGRQEIVDALKLIIEDICAGKINKEEIDLNLFESYLYTRELPALDLVIRTSGELRLSNFLLWQSAYSEIYVTDVLWPDFSENDMDKALKSFFSRDRRYGG